MIANSNPFASRYIRPGAMEYQFFDGRSVDSLAENFCNKRARRFAIVGPHGSGKSTLLHSLVPRLGTIEWTWDAAEESSVSPPSNLVMDGRELKPVANGPFTDIRWIRLTTSSHQASPLFNDAEHWTEKTLLVIDGYEQLGPLQRMKLWRATQRRDVGLLVTCHFPLFFYPTLVTTEVTEASAEYVVRRLLHPRKDLAEKLIRSDRWKAIRDRWQSNLRESLFELYDLMEAKYG